MTSYVRFAAAYIAAYVAASVMVAKAESPVLPVVCTNKTYPNCFPCETITAKSQCFVPEHDAKAIFALDRGDGRFISEDERIKIYKQQLNETLGTQLGTKLDAKSDIFDQATDDAVRKFQEGAGIKVDGKIGLDTHNKLFNVQ